MKYQGDTEGRHSGGPKMASCINRGETFSRANRRENGSAWTPKGGQGSRRDQSLEFKAGVW